jgi:PKD repeat protein
MYRSRKLFHLFLLCVLGCTTYSCKPKVKEILSAEFSTNKRQIIVGDTVRFMYQPTNYDKLYWDFGDGSYSVEKEPLHNYRKEGSYWVTFTVIKGIDTAVNADLKISVLAKNNEVVPSDSVVTAKEAPEKKDAVIEAAKIVIWPLTAATGEIIGYSTKAKNAIEWDFGGKSASETTSGQVSFSEVGKYVVKLIDKASGNVLDTKTITIIENVDDNKFSSWLADLANNKLSRTQKTELSIKVYGYCMNNGEIPISGKETGSFKDFVRKIMIEANPYEEVNIIVTIQLNATKKVSGVKLGTYEKRNI